MDILTSPSFHLWNACRDTYWDFSSWLADWLNLTWQTSHTTHFSLISKAEPPCPIAMKSYSRLDGTYPQLSRCTCFASVFCIHLQRDSQVNNLGEPDEFHIFHQLSWRAEQSKERDGESHQWLVNGVEHVLVIRTSGSRFTSSRIIVVVDLYKPILKLVCEENSRSDLGGPYWKFDYRTWTSRWRWMPFSWTLDCFSSSTVSCSCERIHFSEKAVKSWFQAHPGRIRV